MRAQPKPATGVFEAISAACENQPFQDLMSIGKRKVIKKMKPNKVWKVGDRVWFERVDFIDKLYGTVREVLVHRIVVNTDKGGCFSEHPNNLHRLVKKKRERVFVARNYADFYIDGYAGHGVFVSLEKAHLSRVGINEVLECVVVKRHET